VQLLDELQSRATSLLRAGHVAEGILAHRELLDRYPDLPDGWFNLAYLLRCDRQFEAALAAYAEAIGRGIRDPEEVHLNRAAILSEHLCRGSEAEVELQKALKINPRFLSAWLNLGNLYEDWGQAQNARQAYERALEMDSSNARALARLAAIDVHLGQSAKAVPTLRKAIIGTSGPDAAELGFALGNALDALGDYDEAFAAFKRANNAARGALPRQMRYDPDKVEKLVDSLVDTFPISAGATLTEEPPIFICGMFRSGSTLAEQVLSRHSKVISGGEFDFLPVLVATELQPYPEILRRLPLERLKEVGAAYMRQVDALNLGRGLVTDKRPDNFLHIGLIKALFPNAKIVHTHRHPLDNILSIYAVYFHDTISYGFDLAETAHWYRQYVRLMAHWKSSYPDTIHDFDYDVMVREPRREIGKLLDFCCLDWEDDCLEPGAARGAVRTASVWQVRQPIHARSSGRWRNYAKHLESVTKLI
jgi:tetratricopeptide (TPR) repeat protein